MKFPFVEKVLSVFWYILNYISPRICFLCKSSTLTFGLCSNCWKNVNFISENRCSQCGCALQLSLTEYNLCEMCNLSIQKHTNCRKIIQNTTYVESNISVFMYEGIGKSIILQLKNKHYWYIIPFLRGILSKNLIKSHILYEIDFVMPVPLHYTRLLQRGYNQSEIIAQILAKNLDKKLIHGLKRQKKTTPQEKMNLDERKKNLANAFTVRRKFSQILEKKTILLVDDVMTTGSTLNECAIALKSAGVSKVYSLTLAKTHTPQYIINNLWLKNGGDREI